MYGKYNSALPILERYGIGNATAVIVGLLGMALLLTIGFGVALGRDQGEWQLILGGILGLISVTIILQQPFFGLALMMASVLAITELPEIPGLSSASVLLGGATLGAYLLKHRWDSKFIHPPLFQLNPLLLFMILFILWAFISNPAAAMGWESSRNWMFTFLQLFILAWLMGRLLNTPMKHKVFMGIFAMICVYSAIMMIQSTNLGLAANANGNPNAARSGGLAGGANLSARYFTVAFVFLYYIRSSKSKLISLLALVGMIVTGIGVFATLSRTGFALFIIAFGMILLSEGLITRRYKALLIATMFLAVFMLLLPTQFTDSIEERNETSEEDARWGLWRGGMDMFIDHAISGVGVGRFPEENPNYVPRYLEEPKYYQLGAHNMYVSLLAENGIVGFTLFMLIIGAAYWSYIRVIRTGTSEERSIAIIWMIALTVMMAGGLTKHDQYDKLLWATLGASLCFTYVFQPKPDDSEGIFTLEQRQRRRQIVNADLDDELLGRYPLPKYD